MYSNFFKSHFLKKRFHVYIFLLIFLIFSINLFGQIDDQYRDLTPLTIEGRDSVVHKISELVQENYVLEDIGTKCSDYILEQLQKGSYEGYEDYLDFANRLTKDLQKISKDKHLRVRVRKPDYAGLEELDPLSAEYQQRVYAERKNMGFQKLEIFQGNIGYLQLSEFAPVEIAGKKAAGAMRFLEHTDAIIFDLRENDGGSPALVQYLSSFFFEETTHLNSLYWRVSDRTDEYWTLEYVDGKQRADVPLFIVTSSNTFSSAEEFAYNLQTRNRATIIGEITGGGANPGGMININDNFGIFVPMGRAINPVTGTNWEGVGVEPDIKVKANNALNIAIDKAAKAARAYREKNEANNMAILEKTQKDLSEAMHLYSSNQPYSADSLVNIVLNTCLNSDLAQEYTLNSLGYNYLAKKSYQLAIAIFKFNAEKFPNSWNAYDSLGEAYMRDGQNELAIQNYKKSLEINPQNQNAKKILTDLGVKSGTSEVQLR
jgi:hypothetical protein